MNRQKRKERANTRPKGNHSVRFVINVMLASIFLIIFFASLQLKNQIIYTCDYSASCGCSNRSQLYSKIVGGQNAKIQTWNWIVSLRIRNRFHCAGSIISNSWIVTAAHCFSTVNSLGTDIIRVNPSDITVHAGSNNQYEFSQVRRVMKIIFHEEFDELNFVNDIALLQLLSPLYLNDVMLAKICLPRTSRNEYPPVDSLVSQFRGFNHSIF
jgi:guanylate cyclase